MKRNEFIKTAVVGAFLTPVILQPFDQHASPPLDKGLVEEFVRVAHNNQDEVERMLTEYPTLINSAHDWGGGDFETGLGASSHVGNIELAQYFISQGAQTNIFTACLFGQTNIVKSVLDAFPDTLNAKGPHGFTLLHHAIKGGENAVQVKDYLQSLGLNETKVPLY